MQVRFWGVRGSIPTPGVHTQRWGGNTSCIEVRDEDAPPLIFDAGTGIRSLGNTLLSEPGRELYLMFSHLHMDHVFGLPFFAPVFTPGYRLHLSVPAYSADEARERLARYMNGVFHPVRLRELPAALDFEAVRPGSDLERGAFRVSAFALNHPGGSLAYRATRGQKSVVYLTDSAPFARPGEGVMVGDETVQREQRLVQFLNGADVVIYDTMFDANEYLEKMTWGHSFPEYAVAICRAAKVKRLVLFHHAPERTDDELDVIADHWAAFPDLQVSVAREGEVLAV